MITFLGLFPEMIRSSLIKLEKFSGIIPTPELFRGFGGKNLLLFTTIWGTQQAVRSLEFAQQNGFSPHKPSSLIGFYFFLPWKMTLPKHEVFGLSPKRVIFKTEAGLLESHQATTNQPSTKSKRPLPPLHRRQKH